MACSDGVERMEKREKSAKHKNSGFTMTELAVVLAIIGLLAAVAIPSAIHYIRLAKFRENEENAKTIYMGAESMLTYYRTSGQWDSFCDAILDGHTGGVKNEDFADGDERSGRIYAITLDGASYRSEEENNLVYRLLEPLSYSGDLMNGAIGIEIDIESGEVYSAFYTDDCAGLKYGPENGDGRLSMSQRDYDSRRERNLGYYSVEDVANVVELEPVRLKVTSVNLVNSETLSLNWSSNSRHENMDVEFQIKFFDASDDTELFSTVVNLAELSMGAGQTSGMFRLQVAAPGGGETGWYFPITNDGGRLSLTLDGMMSAEVLYAIEHAGSDAAKEAMSQTSSVSITRFQTIAPRLGGERNIYATVNAVSSYRNMGDDTREYRASNTVTSNTTNTLYAGRTEKKADGTLEAGISAFRHLSNIRYSEGGAAQFTLTKRNMDWKSVGTGLYEFGPSENGVLVLAWKEGSAGLDFPSIPMLGAGQTLEGDGSSTSILNLRLSNASVAGEEARYLGLFCESEGTILGLTFQNPELSVKTGAAPAGRKYGARAEKTAVTSLQGVGILAGRNSGDAENITVEMKAGQPPLEVDLSGNTAPVESNTTAAVGGVVGVFAKAADDGTLKPTDAVMKNIVMEGELSAVLPDCEWDAFTEESTGEIADVPQFGVGGICGYADVTENCHITSCENHAAVTGSSFTGGIAGQLTGPYTVETLNGLFGSAGGSVPAAKSSLYDCANDGLILCGSDRAPDDGRYFGGIVGYAKNVLVMQSKSASGRAAGFSYDSTKRSLLLGDYVGGIAGYGNQSIFYDCGTERNGYVLGHDYVGGIIGGMQGDNTRRISGANVTVNASHVIGNSYVGGIIGENINNRVADCINNGAVAGYGSYIGGIVGYNDADDGHEAEIIDCASYLSDYNDAVYRMIVDEWKTKGDYVGGLAGYNNSRITFTSASAKVSVKAVSAIVVGGDYVGGMVGFNDVNGMIHTDYTLIGGRIYGYGDCVGGCIGFNASVELMKENIAIKPSAVTGRYCVGGVIGANVINLYDGGKDVGVTADGLRADNKLGMINGEAFCGGIIGFQRNYSDALNRELRAWMGDKETAGYKSDIIPQLADGSNVPVYTSAAPNALAAAGAAFTVTSKENSATSMVLAGNNIPIKADLYTGGVIGYCAADSSLHIKNCKNEGNITKVGSSSVVVREFLGADLSEQERERLGDFTVDMIGGVIGVNQKGQTITHCENSAAMYGFIGNGGIVGLNAGLVERCALTDHFGSLTLDYVGGIAGINNGTVRDCATTAERTVSGRNCVGGITGFNLFDGILRDNTCYAGINASGDAAGGIAGRNFGTVEIGEDKGNVTRSVTGRNSVSVGGLVGLNDVGGVIRYTGSRDIVAVGSGVTVVGKQNVGGMVGTNEGTIVTESTGTAGDVKMTVCANRVQAIEGDAGGIAGKSATAIRNMKNASASVTADRGNAGGIVAVNVGTVENCTSNGDVTSSQGNAGGIAAKNESGGTILNCVVGNETSMTLRGIGAEAAGPVCTVNEGLIENSYAAGGGSRIVTLAGNAEVYGGIAGMNRGTIRGTGNFSVTYMPKIESQAGRLTVGGVAGINETQATIENISVKADFTGFGNYRYLGGIAGENRGGQTPDGQTVARGVIANCTYTGKITETTGMTGNCYGGIAGDNGGTLRECEVEKLAMRVAGAYTATSNSTAAQKEELSSHAGGIVGKNEESGEILFCYLSGSADSSIIADSGMLGGVAGYNKGLIRNCGDAVTKKVMPDNADDMTTDELCRAAERQNLKAVSDYVTWRDGTNIENLRYSGSRWNTVSDGKMQLRMEQNGNVGGITAYNAPTGQLEYCVSGDWFINNKSNAIGVGTGGIIGMNESENDLKYLVNAAFVGRQLQSGVTNRFAGGIIGNQNNSTKSGWTVRNCVNYGTVYCYNTHYSGGIMGQWTGTGGTITGCRNYATLQTTCQFGWTGAAAGIVAQLYHANSGDTFHIISCGNYGSIYGQNGTFTGEGVAANDSAGILGNVTVYKVSDNTADFEKGQQFTIQVLDCVNAAGVSIYSSSMASGIVGFFSCDSPTDNAVVASTQNVILRIERCRNFADTLYGYRYVSGIFGDRYGAKGAANTSIKDCFSVSSGNYRRDGASKWYNPVVSMEAKDNADGVQGGGSYFFGNGVGYTNLTLYSDRNGSGNRRESHTYNASSVDSLKTLQRGGGNLIYLVYDGTVGEYAAVAIAEGRTLNSSCRIADGKVTSGRTEIGRVLCYLGETKYGSATAITGADCNYVELVRGSYRYRNIEGMYQVPVAGGTADKLLAPTAVNAVLENGRIHFTVTPASGVEGYYDPFGYEARIRVGDTSYEGYRFYTEEGDITLPDVVSGGEVKVAVRAVSMYDDVLPSDYRDAGDVAAEVLPTPDIRAELIWDAEAGDFRYRFALNNLQIYQDKYPGWRVSVSFYDGTQAVLDAANPTVAVEGRGKNSEQLLVQATAQNTGTGVIYLPSVEASVSVYLPSYAPSVALWGDGACAVPQTAVTGETLSDLRISITLDGSGTGNIEVPPVYRAELTGTWKKGTADEKKDVVFAATDILVAANGTATANLTDFSDELREASDFKVRLWYAEPGLGPVSTWFALDGPDAGGLGELITTFQGLDDSGAALYDYSASPVLLGSQTMFERYKWSSGSLFTFLPAPELMEAPTGADGSKISLTPEFGADGTLYYTFTWDTGKSGADYRDAKYRVALSGINDEGKRVVIDTSAAYTDNAARTMTVEAENWTYRSVELTVTRLGDASDGKNVRVGLDSTEVYRVKQRLAQPGQPVVTLMDPNDLNYTISWTAPGSEDGCDAYRIYVRYKDDVGKEVTEQLGEDIKATGADSYEEEVDLEAFAGKDVSISLMAVAKTDSEEWADSRLGDAYTLQISSRIPQPKVQWRYSWSYDRTKPVEKNAFETGDAAKGLNVSFTADAASIPPGGSAYLLRAAVYDSDAADAEPVAYYPAESDSAGVVSMTAVSGTEYSHTLAGLSAAYAGKYIRFETRITSGNGQVSSKWTQSDLIRLPYVQLERPDVRSLMEWQSIVVGVKDNPDLPPVDKEWQANRTLIVWDEVEYADAVYINLTGRSAGSPTVNYRVLKIEDAALAAGFRIEVQEKVVLDDGTEQWFALKQTAGAEENSVGIYCFPFGTQAADALPGNATLQGYGFLLSGDYTRDGVRYGYETMLYAKLDVSWQEGKFRYTLALPDNYQILDETGYDVQEKTEYHITGTVSFQAERLENAGAQPSEAYVGSEEYLMEINR